MGIELKDAQYLKNAVYEVIDLNKFVYKEDSSYGPKYEQRIIIEGLNGKKAYVMTGWILEEKMRLTSIYVDKE